MSQDQDKLDAIKPFIPEGVSPKRLTFLYQFALAAVALLSLLGQALIQYQLRDQRHDAHVINLAGRERMLSQFIAKQVLALAFNKQTPTPQSLESLKASLNDWQTNFRLLKAGTITSAKVRVNSPTVTNLFAKAEIPFQRISSAVEDALRSMHSVDNDREKHQEWLKASEIVLSAEPEFLQWMDEIVFQYDAEATSRVNRLSQIEWTLLSLTILVLLIEALWIFRPAIQRLQFGLETLARTQRQLVIAKEQAERADQAKNLFLGSMSHELRTPLNAILGLTQQLTYEERNATRLRLFQTITRSARELDLILTNLLEVSQYEAGSRPSIRNTEVDLQVVVADVLEVISVSAAQKQLSVQVHWNPPQTSWLLELDSFRVRQILLNLLSNAVKYTEHGHIDLSFSISSITTSSQLNEISGNRSSDVSHELEINVKDTGIGIATEDQERIFRCFERCRSAETERVPGAGLGLYLVSSLVASMNGRVRVSSALGQGSEFRVLLPTHQVPLTTMHNQQALARPLQVLAIEDSVEGRLILEHMLRTLEFAYEIFEQGDTALSCFARRRFDLVLLDFSLPHMNGSEIAVEIRKIERAQGRVRCPIVAISATLVSKSLDDCFESGIDAYLPKPYTRQQFSETIQRLIEKADSNALDSNEPLPESLASELRALAIQKWPEKIHLMRQAYECRDLTLLNKAAHDSIGLIGVVPQMEPLLDICRRLEASRCFHESQLEWINELELRFSKF